MDWLTDDVKQKLINNGKILKTAKTRDEEDLVPVIYVVYQNCSWLLLSLNPDNENVAYGLCDLGEGKPELGYVDLRELAGLKNEYGMTVRKHYAWDSAIKFKISNFINTAELTGRITLTLGDPPPWVD